MPILDHSDAKAFLRVICEYPDDDLPRLVFADWLDEHAGSVPCEKCNGAGSISDRERFAKPVVVGKRWWWSFSHGNDVTYDQANRRMVCNPCRGTGIVPDGRAAWAEFIRRQCEIDRLLVTTPKNQLPREMTDRESWLMENHAKEWFGSGVEWSNVPEWVNDPNSFGDGPPVWGLVSCGFPAELHAPAEWIWGGECPHCSEGEVILDRRSATWEKCPDCHGTGRTPAYGYDLIGKWPITLVVSGGEPWRYRDHFCWDDIGNVPDAVFDAMAELYPDTVMSPGQPMTYRHLMFRTRQDALDALSRGIVAIGRQRAALPPLPNTG